MAMPTLYGNPAYRKKFDAFRIVDESGLEPLKQAIACALQLRETADHLEKALDGAPEEDRAKLALALARCVPDEFNAWIKIAEFIYSKPKHVEITGHISYEDFVSGSWKPQVPEIVDTTVTANANP